MRQVCTVPLSIAVALAVVLLTAAVVGARFEAGIATAAPATLVTAFRDLPPSVRSGDNLRVLVDVANETVCEGSITYRDNSVQKLDKVSESDGRCRWDVVVLDTTRRGEADVSVTARKGTEQTTITATLDVSRRSDDVGLVLKSLPGAVKRNNKFSVRIDVPDKATCQGSITYEDGKTQTLDPQQEDNEQCSWDMTAPPDVDRGEARLKVAVTQDGRVSTLLTSFDVARGNDDPDILVAFQDLPTTVRRDGAMPIRVLVPATAKCKGSVSFRAADNVKLPEIPGEGGICRWTVTVPVDAKRGDSEVSVTVSDDDRDTSITALVQAEEAASDVDANFKELPVSVRRGDDLDIRVSVPRDATCRGEVRFDDGGISTLDPQAEKKDRCLWSARVPTYTPRGTAIVWVLIDDHGSQGTLTGNVKVEGREDEPLTAVWDSMPKEVVRGQSFDVSVNVAGGTACVGKIDFAGGMRWTLGDRTEDDAYCRWRVDVPAHVGIGKASIQVKAEKDKDTTTLTANVDVKETKAAASSSSKTSAATAATPTPTLAPSPTATATPNPSTVTAPPPPQIYLPTNDTTPSASDADPATDAT